MDPILEDPRVTPTGDGYRVTRDDNTVLTVMPTGSVDSADWAVYFDGSTIEAPRPDGGIKGSLSGSSAAAIEWALRDEEPAR